MNNVTLWLEPDGYRSTTLTGQAPRTFPLLTPHLRNPLLQFIPSGRGHIPMETTRKKLLPNWSVIFQPTSHSLSWTSQLVLEDVFMHKHPMFSWGPLSLTCHTGRRQVNNGFSSSSDSELTTLTNSRWLSNSSITEGESIHLMNGNNNKNE